MLKLIHSSDLHLGDPAGVFGAGAKKHRRLIIETLDKIVQTAIAQKAQLVLLVGDVFDTNKPDEQLVEKFRAAVEKLAAAQIFLVLCPGNHDRLEEGSVWARFNLDANLQKFIIIAKPMVAPAEGQELVHIYLPELQTNLFTRIVAAQKSSQDMTTGMKEFINQVLTSQKTAGQQVTHNIAMLHGSIAREGQRANFPISKVGLSGLLEAGVDYVALGDWHGYLDAGQELGLPAGKVIYSGSPEFLNTAQANAGGLVVVDITGSTQAVSAAGTQIKPNRIKLSELELVKLNLNLNQLNWQTALKQLQSEAQAKGSTKILKLELTGEVSLADLVDIEQNLSVEALHDSWGESFYYLAVDMKVNAAVTDADLAGHPEGSIPHEFIQAVTNMVTSSEIDQELAQKVLAIGMAAILDKLRKHS